jgi:chitin deacetylase
MGLKRFIDYARGHEGVWFATRGQIARHWARVHPPVRRERPSAMDRDAFVAKFGGIFEHSPWIAERAWEGELGPAHDNAAGLHAALSAVFRAASPSERMGVLTAHPDLAGKLAAARRLTAESTAEQASAGLDALTDGEREEFGRLNAAYVARHGFPFIIAVRDHGKAGILSAFGRRIGQDTDAEFAEACAQVERIAYHRLKAILP